MSKHHQIKNLIIGNNKHKLMFYQDRLIARLKELLLVAIDSFDSATTSDEATAAVVASVNRRYQIELSTQVIDVLASFATLASLEHTTRLVCSYRVHELIYRVISSMLTSSADSSSPQPASLVVKLAEACVRTLANTYTSAQVSLLLVYELDAHLYSANNNNNNNNNNLSHVMRLFALSHLTRQSIAEMLLVSAQLLAQRVVVDHTASDASLALCRQLTRHRRVLLEARVIDKMACLLVHHHHSHYNTHHQRHRTSSSHVGATAIKRTPQHDTQLRVLMFYALLAFESGETAQHIMAAACGKHRIVDLISAHLSRDLSATLQLYAAKCLVNVYRAFFNDASLVNNLKQQQQQTGAAASASASSSSSFLIQHTNQLFRFHVLPTLVRLCHTYSLEYRKSSGSSEMSTYLLIESVNTLTYLLELSVDLQHIITDYNLEQIVQALIASAVHARAHITTNTTATRPTSGLKKMAQKRPIAAISVENSSSSEPMPSSSRVAFFSLFHLSHTRFVNKCVHLTSLDKQQQQLQQQQQQYRQQQQQQQRKHFIDDDDEVMATMATSNDDDDDDKDETEVDLGDLGAIIGNSVRQFVGQLEANKHMRVACVCFQALAVLASNDEYTRRNIGDSLDFIAGLIDSIMSNSCDHSNSSSKTHDTPHQHQHHTGNERANDLAAQLLAIDDCVLDDSVFGGGAATAETLRTGARARQATLDFELINMSWLSLLHSLSRSVQQLRTRFLDDKIATYVLEILKRVHARRMKRTVRFYASLSAASSAAMTAEALVGAKAEPQQPSVEEIAHRSSSNIGALAGCSGSNAYYLDGNESEQNLMYLLLAIVANLLLEFSPCKEVRTSFEQYRQFTNQKN